MELKNVRDQDSGTYVCLTPFDSNRGKVHIEVIPACDDPGIPENGFRTGDDFTLGKIVVFWCPEGTTLNQNDRRIIIRCMSIDNVAQWTDETPICFK
ncbi:CUB and sushi domain-containing protein 2-like, partial [Anneissia japonica]|uniref:CUB and sushi domain-containing protein 2-like n=1 Tax=Anneissia japonica TaxID=1529436 RepID=UPI0014255575